MNTQHEEHKNAGIFKIGINLTIACLLSGLVISGTYIFTAPKAAVEREKLKNQAMQELVSEAQSFNNIQGKEGWFEAQKDGKVFAYIVPVESKGYGGKIKILTAVTPDGRVIDYKIISHNETPGLGDNAAKPKFRSQFGQKTASELVLVRTPDSSGIQAITGATITSRAVTNGVKQAVEEVMGFRAAKKE